MKKQLTREMILADMKERSRRMIITYVMLLVVTAAMGLFSFSILLTESATTVMLYVSFGIILVYFLLLVTLEMIRMKRAEKGEFTVESDVMYRKDKVRRGRRHSSIPTIFLTHRGRYYPGDVDMHTWENAVCGDTIYLVYAGVFPNKILLAYDSTSYEYHEDTKTVDK